MYRSVTKYNSTSTVKFVIYVKNIFHSAVYHVDDRTYTYKERILQNETMFCAHVATKASRKLCYTESLAQNVVWAIQAQIPSGAMADYVTNYSGWTVNGLFTIRFPTLMMI